MDLEIILTAVCRFMVFEFARKDFIFRNFYAASMVDGSNERKKSGFQYHTMCYVLEKKAYAECVGILLTA